jgi:hypothetical protein
MKNNDSFFLRACSKAYLLGMCFLLVQSAGYAQFVAPGNTSPLTGNIQYSNGNVGIGTGATAPGSIFHIQSSTSQSLRFTRTGVSGTWGFEIGTGIFGLYDYTQAKFVWRATNGNLFLVESGGNVLIGKVSQVNTAYILDVNV